MALFRTFSLDGENSADYGLFISGAGVYNAPSRAVQLYSIPGKNGALAIDGGLFENIEVAYPAAIVASSQEDFRRKLAAARNWLASKYSYVRLSDDYHPDEFRLAIFKDGLEVSPAAYNHAGSFSIVFNCKPQRFLLSGDTPWEQVTNYQALMDENSNNLQNENSVDIEGAVSEVSVITNPTPWPSKPLIAATGPGSIGIGSYQIHVAVSENVTVYIDCESMEIYRVSGASILNMSSSVELVGNDFPELVPGNNAVTHTMPIQIIPRFWRI